MAFQPFGREHEHASPERLKGFMMAAWVGAMLPQNEANHLKAMDIVGDVCSRTL